MKYLAMRHMHIVLSFFVLLFCIRLGVPIIKFRTRDDICGLIIAIGLFSFGILYFVHSFVGVIRRYVYKKNGTCIQGCIIGAERIMGHKRTGSYFLKILFFDEVKKVRYTEAYMGNPNDILQDCFCNIYKWKGKYIEADFNTLDEKQESFVEMIPVKVIWNYPFFKIGKVKDIQ